jgi:trimeric autotransporter adhesin
MLMQTSPARLPALLLSAIAALLMIGISTLHAAPTTAFTYQGHLRTDLGNAHGPYDFEFALFESPENGEPHAAPIELADVPIEDGRFTVLLDFGLDPFSNLNLWLEVAVRPHPGTTDFVVLHPRQQLTPVPFAIRAVHSAEASLALSLPPGSITSQQVAEATITANLIAPDQLVTSLNGLHDDISLAAGPNLSLTTNGQVLTLAGTADWQLDGNGGTDPSIHFLGTTDAQPLEFRVQNTRALRLMPGGHPGVVNVLGGSRGNYIDPQVSGSIIAGGGASYGAAGEYTNSLHSSYATIAGGWANVIDGSAASSFIGGGHSNRIHHFGFESVIAGGLNNHIVEDGWQATIGGGSNNRIESTGYVATISGGSSNRAGSYYTTLGGGARNAILHNARYATISGGGDNFIHQNSFSSVIGGGGDNQVLASSERSTIGGGKFNQINTLSPHATIAGGFTNRIGPNAHAATIPGGDANRADGRFAFAAGQRAHALHSGAFVWADATKLDFASTTTNEFSVRALGGVRFVSAVDFEGTPASGVTLEPGGGSWSSLSDRDAKENFDHVDPRGILDQLLHLPILSWNYKAQSPSIRHLGPVAQDFQAAFELGTDPRRITTMDANGVALAAIQGLHQLVTDKESRIQLLERQNQELEQRLNALESILRHLSPPHP